MVAAASRHRPAADVVRRAMSALVVLLVVLAVAAPEDLSPPEVRVAAGALRGKWIASRPSGRTIAAFEGIPFAEPPVGPLRFKAPVPKEPWTGVRAADQPGDMCTQQNGNVVEGKEDCLHLNVYYPKLSERKALPVMVWLHGGGYLDGNGFMYGPEYLLERNVVYVSLNYRLGTLGFLSTGDDVIAGNFALKDHVLALRWVRDNIHAFGGDAESITIFGQSAGAVSVQYLMLSPLAKGLFHRGIQMSSSAVSAWNFDKPATARAKAHKVAASLDCPTNSSRALRDCLLSKTAEEIIRATAVLKKLAVRRPTPTAEPSGPDAFLDKHPVQVYADGGAHRVPLMIGIVAHEGCSLATWFLLNETLTEEWDQRFNKIAPDLFLSDHLPTSLNEKVYTELRRAYFGQKPIDRNSLAEFLDFMTDGFFAQATIETVKLQVRSAKSPVYLYEIGRAGERTYAQPLLGTSKNTIYVCHGDDIQYLFPATASFPAPPSEADMAFSSTMVELFTTFATTGAPTTDGSWPHVQDLANKTEHAYLGGPGPVTVRAGFHNERMARWAKLPVNVALTLPSDGNEAGSSSAPAPFSSPHLFVFLLSALNLLKGQK